MPRNVLPYQTPFYAGLLAAVVVLYLLIAGLYAALTPPWQSPDEPAHYNYVAQVAGRGCCPIIEAGDWNAERREQVVSTGFLEGVDLSWMEYEDHQPPLYYVLAAPVFRLSGGSLIALRLFSAALGAGIVIAAFYAAARLFPQQPAIALAAALFVGFVPQHAAILASVNNDSLAGLLLGVLMVVAVGYIGNPIRPDYDGNPLPFDDSQRPHAAALGGVLGLIFLTKLTAYGPGLVIVLAAIAWRWRIEGRPAGWLVQQVFWAMLLGLGIGAWWWLRNASVYGFPDVLAQAAHNAVVVGQPRTADRLAADGPVHYLREALRTMYRSFWGQFGWMGVPMQPRAYAALGSFLVWALAGVAGSILWNRREADIQPQQRAGLWTLAWAAIATVAEVVYYNLTFVQFQGRYLYPALIPFALLVALGAWGWAVILRRQLAFERGILAAQWANILLWLPPLAVMWMPFFALYALFRYVVPFLE